MAEPGVTTYCYCWVIERTDGVIIGTTDHDETVVVNGVTCESVPGITTTRFSKALGLRPSDMEVEGYIDGEAITDEDMRAGKYDDADATLYIVDWQDPTDFKILGTGKLGKMFETEEGEFMVEHLGLTDTLSQPVGRVYQRTCDTKLGSSRCGVDLTDPAYRATVTVVSVDGASIVVSGVSGFDNDWFSLGGVATANGYEIGIRLHSGNTLNLWREPDVTISAGDELVVTAGCKQDVATCHAKFDNVVNFQGFPRMPGRDRLTTYPVRGTARYDGGSLFE